MIQSAGQQADSNNPISLSVSGVRYGDGVIQVSTPALSSQGFGMPWGVTPGVTNGPGYASQTVNGVGTVVSEQPYLQPVNGTNSIAVIENTIAEYFDWNGTSYVPRFFDQNQLVDPPGTFTLTTTAGYQYTFADFSSNYPAAEQGQLLSATDPYGNTTTLTYNAAGQLTQVERSTTVNGTTTTEAYFYTYVATGLTAGLVQNVALERQVNGGPWSTVRQVTYTYYDGTQPYGNLGDLQTATVADGAGNALDTYYYRYYTAGEANGYTGGLMYYFDSDSYARLAAAVGDPLAATDSQVAPYATDFYQYDGQHRVTLATVQGAGGDATGGLGTYTYSYTTSTNPAGENSWAVKTVEGLPNGSHNIVYTNAYGQVMLSAFVDAASGQQTINYYRYDAQGRAVLFANPSAVTGYDDSYADLVNYQDGTYQYLNASSGLINLIDYYQTTTATETTAGGVYGYQQDSSIQQGYQGTPILQESWQYFQHTAGGITVDPVATDTVFRNTDGTGAETTSYAYTWFTGTVQMQSMTTSLPVISATQNGPGTADVSTSVFDIYGNDIWDKDADGYINYAAYDIPTGAVTESIVDVNTADGGEFQNLPAGWHTPSGGGLNLITQYVVDSLGRTTEEIDPKGTITYTVYDDPDHEYRVYAGWNSSTGMPTGPTQVYREDRANGYTEMLTMAAVPNLTDGVPNGTEPISDVQTLSRSYMNLAEQAVREDDYFNLATTMPVADPGFEMPNVGTGSYGNFQYNPTGSPWTYDSGSGVAGNGSGFTSGNPNAPDGTQVAFLQENGSFSQAVVFAAGTYTIGFLAAQRQNYQASSQTFEVLVDGNVVGTFTPGSTNYSNFTTGNFTVTAGTHTVEFLGLDPNGSDNTAFIDSVNIQQVGAVTYSTSPYIGTANVNYYTTLYGYDSDGNQNRVVAPTGTITDTVYDSQDRVTSVWVGTNDSTTEVPLDAAFNRAGIQVDGTTFSTGGFDADGNALSANLLGSLVTWNGAGYAVGPAGVNDTVSAQGQTISLPVGEYQTLSFLAAGVNGNQPDQTFTVTYTDGTTQTFTQSISDWFTPQGYAGESTAVTMAYRDTSSGGQDDRNFNLYGYQLTLEPGKQVESIILPNNGNVMLAAMDLTPAQAPVGNNPGPSNMVEVSANVYDNGGVGDSNLTQTTQFPGGTAAPRVTQYFFDWRDREVAEKDGVQANEADGTNRPIYFTTYDNLDEDIADAMYTGDGVTIQTVDGVPQAPNASLLRSYSTTEYDDQGRVYQSNVFDVNPTTGAISTSSLTTNYYYDHRGDLVAESDPGGLWTKDVYDGADRLVMEYTTDGGAGMRGTTTPVPWGDATNIADDIVLEQVQTVYDANSNPIETIDTQRYPDTFGTGSLTLMGTGPFGRTYYSGTYYDLADRPVADVNVGTNGGTAWVMPSTVPDRADTVLVTSYTYDAAGWLQSTIDPAGLVDEQTYDALDRLTRDVQNYTDGVPTTDSDQTTLYTYDGDNNQLTVTAARPSGTPSQTTQYVYGVTTAGGSAVNNNDLLAATLYPDPITGQPSTGQEDTYTYNALGQVANMTDRNGNTHQYTYDVLGRETSDTVTAFGYGVDQSVKRIDTAYDQQGNPYLFTSYADTAGTTVVNQVKDLFNGLGQLTTEYQSVSGAVDLSTTPSVQYEYTDMAGGQNNSRLTSMTYPNGRVLDYNYDSGLDSNISRLSSISDNSGILEAYKYLGQGTVVERDHPQTGVNETFLSQNGSTGDAGDGITGLDRFGRIVEDAWINATTGQATDDFTYTYDRDSNVLTRTNALDAAFSQSYTYNGFNQLTGYTQGDGTSQDYGLDALGNFTSVTTNGTQQTRTSNAQNEITSISGATTPTYDPNGNLTTDETGQNYTYDAWNRLVQVTGNGNTVSYTFDALGRRITETTNGATRDLYFDGANVIEERLAGSNNANIQYVWDPLATNTLVLRDRDTTGNGTLDERLYVQQDANGNVTALVNTTGAPVERYDYTPFGKVNVYDGTWNPLSGTQYGFEYGFQGMRVDWVTMNLASWGRTYRPSLEIWTSMDAIPAVNAYMMEFNNPTGYTDPTGLEGNNLRLLGVNANWTDKEIAAFRAVQAGWHQGQTAPALYTGQTQLLPIISNFGRISQDGPTIYGDSEQGIQPSGPWKPIKPEKPGELEALLPFWGSAKSFSYDMNTQQYGWAAVDATLFATDFFLIRSLVMGTGRALVVGLGKGGLKEASHVTIDAGMNVAKREIAAEGAWRVVPGGCRIRQVGGYVVKEVDPNASRLVQFWARGSMDAQARALVALGDMAPNFVYQNGKLVVRNAGRYQGRLFPVYVKGSWRLGTPANDIAMRNIGAYGKIFDPALHPFQQGIYVFVVGEGGLIPLKLGVNLMQEPE